MEYIAGLVGGNRVGEDITVTGVSSLEDAGPTQLSLCVDNRYLAQLRNTKAAGVLLRNNAKLLLENAPCSVILVDDPRYALMKVLEFFYPEPNMQPGVQEGAQVHATATIDQRARVDAGAHIGAGSSIGAGSWIESGVYIGSRVAIGLDCRIGANTVITDGCRLGDRVLIEPCSVIGSRGFGFVKTRGAERRSRIPQIGIVVIGNDVEIGAGCTIDKATMGATRIGAGVKLDNQVHVGHNVVLQENVVIAAQTGLSGSVMVEKGALIGGQVGVADHVVIEAGAQVGSKSGVATRVPAGIRVAGFPAVPIKKWLEEIRILRKMSGFMRRSNKKG